MMIKKGFIFLIFVLHVFSVSAFSQRMHGYPSQENLFGSALFQYNIYNFAGNTPDSSRLDFYISFVNDLLQFVKIDNDLYQAEYELTIAILDKDKNPVQDRFMTGTLEAAGFSETNSRVKGARVQITMYVPPGKYFYLIQLIDKDTRQTLERSKQITVRDFAIGQLHLSDIVFVDQIETDDNGVIRMVPNLRALINNKNSNFQAYTVVYPPDDVDSVRVIQSILTRHDKLVDRKIIKVAADRKAIPLIIDLKDRIDAPGRYWLKLEVSAGKNKVEIKRRFAVEWKKLVVDETNLKLAIEQLEIIAGGKELKKIKTAKGEEQVKLYDEFWQKRDPDPSTSVNELKEEFFRRIDFANRNFISTFSEREGWETDRGRVYIKYGEPSQVERQATEINMPSYEIWYYNSIQKRFIFSDRHGTGEYRLVRME